eukprot:3255099-Rhodomonas_salina.1
MRCEDRRKRSRTREMRQKVGYGRRKCGKLIWGKGDIDLLRGEVSSGCLGAVSEGFHQPLILGAHELGLGLCKLNTRSISRQQHRVSAHPIRKKQHRPSASHISRKRPMTSADPSVGIEKAIA